MNGNRQCECALTLGSTHPLSLPHFTTYRAAQANDLDAAGFQDLHNNATYSASRS